MADVNLYIKKIPLLEGTKVEEGDYQGQPTKFGVSAALVKTATGLNVSADQIRNASLDTPFIVSSIAYVWHKFFANNFSQSLAELIVDAAYNTGVQRVSWQLQNFLVRKYKAKIKVDGKVGAQTLGAMMAAVQKYGEAHFYANFRQLRENYYYGKDMTGTGQYLQGCQKSVCRKVAVTRLDRYFPKVQNASFATVGSMPQYDPETPVSDEGIANENLTTKATVAMVKDTAKRKWWVIGLISLIGIIALAQIFTKP